MQPDQGITDPQFLAVGQEPLIKLEIYVNGNWLNLCDLPVERLTDGGLEDWTGAEDLTYYTEFDGGTAQEGVFQESTTVHSGTYSARLLTTAGGDYAGFYQDITLTPTNSATISLWYLREAHASCELRVYVNDTGNNVSLKSDGTWQAGVLPILLPVSAVWLLYTLAFTVHASYTDYRIRIYKSHGAGGAISFYVDDMSVSEIKNPALGVTEGGNYVESVSLSLGGASMTPNPVAGKWSAMLFDPNSVFYPQHPTSVLNDYIKTGVKARIFVGAIYDDTSYYWKRITGYMDIPKFNLSDHKISISGGDYMKLLQDKEFKFPDNYWGGSELFDSIDSEGLQGIELYVEGDAMDVVTDGANIGTWETHNCDFVHFDPGGPNPQSTWAGKATNQTFLGEPPYSYVKNTDVMTADEGHKYRIKFWHRIVDATGVFGMSFRILQGGTRFEYRFYYPTNTWTEETVYFTAPGDGAIELRFGFTTAYDCRIDQISIYEYIDYWDRHYDITDVNETGPYYLTLDDEPVWQGEEDEGWWYDSDNGYVFFDKNKTVADGTGTDNIEIFYFLPTKPEDVIGDLLYWVGLYDNRADALTAMGDPDTGIEIDKIWFEVGTTYLNAIKMICERCDWRFYFKYDGTPVFAPKSTPVDPADFTFTDPKHITSVNTYQDWNEIKNRIVIEGIKQAEPVGREETTPSEFKGELSDADSIAVYGERTLTINNYLFQTQDSILNVAGDAGMCFDLLAEYKDPKWYADIKMNFNPVPLELGDTIKWEEMLSPDLDITKTGLLRDIKITNFGTTYKCELVI